MSGAMSNDEYGGWGETVRLLMAISAERYIEEHPDLPADAMAEVRALYAPSASQHGGEVLDGPPKRAKAEETKRDHIAAFRVAQGGAR